MSLRGRSVSTWAIIRTTRDIDPSISSSRAQISGTSPNPRRRAAYAGNSETRSEVAVKITEMKSSTSSPLDSMTSVTISATRSSMWSRTSSSSWVAPRTALTATRATLTGLVAPEGPLVAFWILDRAAAAAVVLVDHLPDHGRAGGHGPVEEGVGVVGDEVRRG